MQTTAASLILPRCRNRRAGGTKTNRGVARDGAGTSSFFPRRYAMNRSLPGFAAIAAVAALGALCEARAFSVNIGTGTRAIYLQVGNGSFTGTYSAGGTPGTNASVNQVTVTVPAAVLGSGAAQQMTSNSTQATSFYDNFTFCNPPVQVYIGGCYPPPGTHGTPPPALPSPSANLVNAGGATIPFTHVSLASTGPRATGRQAIPGRDLPRRTPS